MLEELRAVTPALKKHIENRGEDDEYVCESEPLATWWVQATPGTTYWRCVVPARALPGQALHLRYSDAVVNDDGEAIIPRHKGAGIWQFVGNATRALLMSHSQNYLGSKALMEMDDNYLVPSSIPGATPWGRRLDRSEKDDYSHQAHRKVIRWVDGLIVATDVLAEQYEKHTSAPIYVCPNSIDLADWPDHAKGVGTVGTERNIGYAGSASHRYDIALVERGLDWAARSGARVFKIGVTEKPFPFPHESISWARDLTEYRRNLQVLDVGLCPLKRTTWHDSKSDIKAMEYILSGAVPIVQKAPPYKDWFDLVPTCETEKDWRKAIKWAALASADELREVWERAYAFLLQNKLIDQHIDKWRTAIR